MRTACLARPGLVAVIGAPGVGKSRLREEAEALLRAAGLEVVTLAGGEGTCTVRLGAFAPLLPAVPDQAEAHLVAHLVRALAPADTPTVVSVDDAHLLDDVSIGVLAAALREGARVLATVRRPAPLPPALQDLMLHDSTVQLELPPLPDDEVAALAEQHLGAPLTPTARRAVVRTVAGNPLLLREVLADAVASRALARGADGYDLRGELAVGDRVAALVRSRVDRLGADDRELVELVAVAEQLPLACLDPGRERLVAALEERGLLKVEELAGTWTVRPGHPSIGEALARTLTRSTGLQRLRTLCELATALEEPPPGLARASAAWFERRGEPTPPAVAARAAWETLVALDLDHAAELATQAATQHWRAAFVLAEVARWRGDVAAAVEHLARAARLAPDPAALRRVVMARSALEAWQRGDIPAAIEVLREGAERTDDPETCAFLLCEAAMLATLLGDFDEAVRTSRDLLASGPSDPVTVWNTTINLGYAQVMRGSLEDVAGALATARSVHPTVRREQPEGADLLVSLEVGAALLAGDLAAAAALAQQRIDALAAEASPVGSAAAIAADIQLLAAHPGAPRMAERALADLRRQDAYGTIGLGLAHASILHAVAGELELARALVDELAGAPIDARVVAAAGRARAALAAAEDGPEAAGKIAWQGALAAVEDDHLTLGSLAGLEALAHWPTTERALRLAKACALRDAPFLVAVEAFCRALADGDPEQVRTGVRRLAGPAPYLAALGLTAWSRMADAEVEARRAAACSRAALVGSPWLAAAPFLWTPPDGVSERELAVAIGAASGLTNKEIGAQHFVSDRTVGNQLYSTYAKLGVSGRDELRATLAPWLGSLRP